MIYEHQGKRYVRMGSCLRCGMCCVGFNPPCSYLAWPEADFAECKVYDRRGTASLQGATSANLLGCIDFPDGPQAQLHPSIKEKCGYYFIEVEKILIACPTYDGKEYCFDEYLRAIEGLDWPVKDYFLVDTSEREDFYYRWKDRIRIERIDVRGEEPNRRIALGMERIREYFLSSDCNRWLNIEADIIVPEETIKVLLSADRERKMDWISHIYPARSDRVECPHPVMAGFGIGLFSRRMIEEQGFADAPSDTTTDGWYWQGGQHYKALEIWNLLDVKHRG